MPLVKIPFDLVILFWNITASSEVQENTNPRSHTNAKTIKMFLHTTVISLAFTVSIIIIISSSSSSWAPKPVQMFLENAYTGIWILDHLHYTILAAICKFT